MLEPDFILESAYLASPVFLAKHNIKAILLDLDDTIVASKSDYINDNYRIWINNLKEAEIPLLILSNGSPKRVKYWTQELDLKGFYLVGKPFSFAFRRALNLLNCSAKETAMIGDQVFTDILGANLAGLKSILVRPLSPGGMWHTRAIRNIEKLILKGEDNARIINW